PDLGGGARRVPRHGRNADGRGAGGGPDDGPHGGLRDERAQEGVPDRVRDLPPLRRHRPGRGGGADEHGDVHASAGDGRAPAQAHALRPRRRLDAPRPEPLHQLPLRSAMSYELVVDLVRNALNLALMLSAPLLGVALAAGLLISVLQAATQIQEQTLAIVVKFFSVGLVFLVALPWLLQRAVQYTVELFRSLPLLVS